MRTKVIIPSVEGRLTVTIDTEEGRCDKIEENKTESQKTTVVETEMRKGNYIVKTRVKTMQIEI